MDDTRSKKKLKISSNEEIKTNDNTTDSNVKELDNNIIKLDEMEILQDIEIQSLQLQLDSIIKSNQKDKQKLNSLKENCNFLEKNINQLKQENLRLKLENNHWN